MRKCFENDRINYEKYDQCFENALKVESANTLCRIAIARLRWPTGLKEEARTLYENALKENPGTAITLAVRDRDLALLLFLCRYFSAGDYGEAIAACVDADWSEGKRPADGRKASKQQLFQEKVSRSTTFHWMICDLSRLHFPSEKRYEPVAADMLKHFCTFVL